MKNSLKYSLIEFTIGVVISLLFEFVLKTRDIALILFGSSLLISFSTFIIIETLSYKLDQHLEFWEIIGEINDIELSEEASKVLIECKRQLINLRNGIVELTTEKLFFTAISYLNKYKGNDDVKCVYLVQIQQKSSAAYQNFLNANEYAIRRGCSIKRIFIVDEVKPNMLISNHKSIGVKVFLASGVPKELQEDYMIFNNLIVIKAEWSVQNRIVLGSLIKNPEIVKEYLQKYARLETLAVQY